MDFLDRLIEYLEGLMYMPSIIKVGLYDENKNSVAIRPTPSNLNDRDLEGAKTYNFSFQVLAHNKINQIAYHTLQQLLDDLDMLDREAIESENDTFELVVIYCTTTPNFVQKTGYGYLWTAMFEAELFLKG